MNFTHRSLQPLKYSEYPGLGNFVNRQRTEYRKLQQGKTSSMTSSKIRQLDAVDFHWSIREGGHSSWETRLNDLRAYINQHGDANVPKVYPPNPQLGYWVNEQRFQYQRMRNGKSSYMTERKAALLNALHFKWSLRGSKRPFNEWMEALRRYKAKHGHINVPLKYSETPGLGTFVNNQRSEYRKYMNGNAKTSMTEERVKELESIGITWNLREGRTPWSERFKELKEYKSK